MKFNEIFEGWRNDLFPKEEMKELIKTTQEERLYICLNCPKNSSNNKITNFSFCRECGCPLKKKTACLSCECPLGKWEAIANNEQHEIIKKQLNQKENESS